MPTITVWNEVDPDRLTYRSLDTGMDMLAWKLTSLPDFSGPRFDYLGKEIENRVGEVGKRQYQMLRALHGLGQAWSASMRIEKAGNGLTLYLVFRHARALQTDRASLDEARTIIRNALPSREYSFAPIDDTRVRELLELPWAREAAQIIKAEHTLHGANYPKAMQQPASSFYVADAWQSTSNDMQLVCQALMSHPGRAVFEATLTPTAYIEGEKSMLGKTIARLRERERESARRIHTRRQG